MGFASGTFTFTANTFAPTPVTGTTISSTDAISTWSEIATALSTCLLKDGSQTATYSIPFVQGIAVTTAMTTPSTTFALINTTATTVNFAGAATTFNLTGGTAMALNIGNATGTATLGGSWCAQNSQSAAYPLVAADANKHILHPTSDDNPRMFTIPANSSVAFPIGTMITFINMQNTVTIAITTDTMTMMGSGATGSRTLAENGIATALKITSTTWVISGTNLS